jgi:CBS domain-containing protein
MVMNSYDSLKNWRESEIEKHLTDSAELNHFHDTVMKKVYEIALERMKEQYGEPPSLFSWFLMGSAGRFEQAIISDQDHGLIYEESDEKSNEYFQKLGKELTSGLHAVGYPYCDGHVMSSNPVWCKSIGDWEAQMTKWLEEESFESIRFLLIFYDARVLIGEEKYVSKLKQQIHKYIETNPHFMERLLENTIHVKKAVGVFQQFLTETHGYHTGSIDLKHSGFFPFVNCIRLFALKEKAASSTTLSRIDELSRFPAYAGELGAYRADFEKLLGYRLKQHQKSTEVYDDVHYLNIKELDKTEKKELKNLLKNGMKLQEYTKSVIKGKMHK